MALPRSAAILLIALSLAVVTGCGGGSSPHGPAGMATVLQGSRHTISAPGAAWTVQRERLLPPRGQHLLQFLANTPARRLVYEQRERPSGCAFRMLSETFGQALAGNDHNYGQPAVAGGRWAVAMLERVRRLPGSGRPGDRLSVVIGDVASGRALRRGAVATAERIEGGGVVLSARGDVAVTWAQCREGRDACSYEYDEYLAVRRAGRRDFDGSELVARDTVDGGFESYYSTAMAFAPDGDLLVVEDADELRARLRPAGGRLGPPRRLGDYAGGQLVVASTGDGRWVVAWSRRRAAGLMAAVATRGRFGPVEVFASGRRAPRRLAVVAGAATATLAWSDDRTTWTSDLRDGARLTPRRRLASCRSSPRTPTDACCS